MTIQDETNPCEICSGEDFDAWQGCGDCEGTGEDFTGTACCTCGAEGEVIIEHCCACGGSPYCNCCTTCGACVGACNCPIRIEMHDGTTRAL